MSETTTWTQMLNEDPEHPAGYCGTRNHYGMAFLECADPFCGKPLCAECAISGCEACPSDRKFCDTCVERIDYDALPFCREHVDEGRREMESEFGVAAA